MFTSISREVLVFINIGVTRPLLNLVQYLDKSLAVIKRTTSIVTIRFLLWLVEVESVVVVDVLVCLLIARDFSLYYRTQSVTELMLLVIFGHLL